jgi:ADP-heptose:LPS heptosyltransferase
VLLVRPRTGLGDLLCHVPALRALRARLPGAHVAFAGFADVAPVIARQRAYVDEFVAFPGYPGVDERPVQRDRVEPWLAEMRARRFDLAVQFHSGNPAVNIVTERVGARQTAGFFAPGAWEPDLRTHLPLPEHLHEVRRHLALMEHLGAPPAGERLEFPVEDADEEEAAAAGLDPGRPYAVLHPGASAPSRRWPPERFAAVGDALAARGLEVLVTGVRSEAATVAEVVRRMRAPARDLTGRLSLGGLAAVLRHAALLVTNDTGPAHLAAALGTPSVTVFLSESPHRWAHDPARHRVARVQVACSPCRHVTCPIDHRCATAVTAGHVLREADALLSAGDDGLRALDVAGHLLDERVH